MEVSKGRRELVMMNDYYKVWYYLWKCTAKFFPDNAK